MSENLWELESLVNDAIDCLKRAETMAGTFCLDEKTGEPLPWMEMAATAERIHAVVVLAESLGMLTPISKALQDERDEIDRLADLADGASY